MTNDCVSITKTLMTGLKLMTGRYKEIRNKGQCKDKQASQKEFINFPEQK